MKATVLWRSPGSLAVLAHCLISVLARADDASISPARSEQGILVHAAQSPRQATATEIRVVVPDKRDPGRRYPVVYVLPVEPGRGTKFGESLKEVVSHDLHNRFAVICVEPTFAGRPWIADHPSDSRFRNESYLLQDVIPFIDRTYPVNSTAEGRLLAGFSKSGYAAFSLLLRHPDVFARAAAFDASFLSEHPNPRSIEAFGTPENARLYSVPALVVRQASQLQSSARLMLIGDGPAQAQHVAVHKQLLDLKIPHEFRTGSLRKHRWDSGWLPEAVEWLTTAEATTPR